MKKFPIIIAVLLIGINSFCSGQDRYVMSKANYLSTNVSSSDEISLELNNAETFSETTINTETSVSNLTLSIPKIIMGLRLMPTVSSFDLTKIDNSTIESSSVLSFGFGGMLGVNVTDHTGIQAEVIYSTLQQKYKVQDVENEIKLSYVNVPLLLVLNTSYSFPINFNVAVGPQFGFNTGAKLGVGNFDNGTDTVHAILSVKSHDLGFAYGAGVDIGFGTAFSTRLSLGFRGVYGLIDISAQSKNITTSEYYILDKTHLNTYSAYIGLTFTL